MIQLSETVSRAGGESDDGATVVDCPETVQSLLAALNADDGHAILDATDERARSASEISEACDIPLSTTYRKLSLFTEAGLLEERTRARCGRKPVNEYRRLVDDIELDIGADGEIRVRVSHRERSEGGAPVEPVPR
ncbi:DNA-binding transcriptional ArsR family regulator [Halarchaeum solikamskense]|uniref:winged helix-turn-helix domain-containing protein n=1 Tax=Halarchaeum nitratireducens TaxID=489913 RepID=UPI001B3A8E48|nr:helix-turn-helix domain-containing protein [Halarchaeum solikamskense]MBP2251053.1 DNA-binding transcriptional ArsR family regulator [Halarchaeum solikamskense]